MSAETLARPVTGSTADEDGLDHVVCECDEDTALCGLDVTDLPLIDDDEPTGCVVCADLEDHPCERCGA